MFFHHLWISQPGCSFMLRRPLDGFSLHVPSLNQEATCTHNHIDVLYIFLLLFCNTDFFHFSTEGWAKCFHSPPIYFSFAAVSIGRWENTKRAPSRAHTPLGGRKRCFSPASDLKTHLSLCATDLLPLKAAFVRVINGPLPALYPPTNNYANKNQWARQH